MLKSWSLGGFKSFNKINTLDMAPITIFAGANSSGKSTILQSILLLKQTIQYGSKARPLSLNGPLIRLGTFDDVIHSLAIQKKIFIDFCFEIPPETPRNAERAQWLRFLSRYFHSSEQATTQRILGSFSWEPRSIDGGSGTPIYDKLQSTLAHGSLSATRVPIPHSGSGEEITHFCRYTPFATNIAHKMGQDDSNFQWMSVTLDQHSETELIEDKPDGHIRALVPNFFLPGFVYVSFSASKQLARNIANSIFGLNSRISRTRFDIDFLPSSVISAVNNWLMSKGHDPIPKHNIGVSIDTLSERLMFLRHSRRPSTSFSDMRKRPEIGHDMIDVRDIIEQTLATELPESVETELEVPRIIDSTCDFITTYLRLGVRYLGPLRDEPRPVYPLEALENTTDVGYRGEHTAAVLYLYGDTNVRFIGPEELESGSPVREGRQAKLRHAVSAWLRYMGVADDVLATDAGVFGNQLQVTTEGLDKKHDLTNVGVGVSQVLPIVVSALLAPQTSILIFEQPELHLHPKVQARLADFFYSIALSGKQCILESHSEYMIDRFRRRIAEEKENRLQSMLALYFTEKSRGETKCRRVNVSRYGSIVDWPKDFFEQSQNETKILLEAASAKRLWEKENKK